MSKGLLSVYFTHTHTHTAKACCTHAYTNTTQAYAHSYLVCSSHDSLMGNMVLFLILAHTDSNLHMWYTVTSLHRNVPHCGHSTGYSESISITANLVHVAEQWWQLWACSLIKYSSWDCITWQQLGPNAVFLDWEWSWFLKQFVQSADMNSSGKQHRSQSVKLSRLELLQTFFNMLRHSPTSQDICLKHWHIW